MVFIPESKVFFVCCAIVFKAFQRGPTKYFLQISLFLPFPSYFPHYSGQQKYMACLFKLSSRLIVERHLPTSASDAYGIGFVEETRTTRDQYCGCIATVSDRKLLHSHSVELIGLVILCVFFPLDCCLCSPDVYILEAPRSLYSSPGYNNNISQ